MKLKLSSVKLKKEEKTERGTEKQRQRQRETEQPKRESVLGTRIHVLREELNPA